MDVLRWKRSRRQKAAAPPTPLALSLTPMTTAMSSAPGAMPALPSSPTASSPTSSHSGTIPASPAATIAVSTAAPNSAHFGKSKSHNDMATLSSGSRASSFDSGKSGFFQNYMPRAMRSLSRSSTSSVRPSAHGSASSATTTPTTATTTAASAGSSSASNGQQQPLQQPDSPSTSSSSQTLFTHVPRKVLRKSHNRLSSSEMHVRRGSSGSDLFRRMSRSSHTVTGSASSNVASDWHAQPVEMHTALDSPESLPLKSRLGYLALTADFLLLFRTRADAFAALPQLADAAAAAAGPDSVSPTTTAKPVSSMLPPDPALVIPLHAIISVYRAETPRPPFAIDIWWRLPYPAIATSGVTLYVKDQRDRDNYLEALAAMVKIKTREQPDPPRISPEVEECIRKVVRAEEPSFLNSVPEIFPVVYRNAPERGKSSRSEDKQKRAQQLEGSSSYFLVIGVNLCFFIEIGRASAIHTTALDMRYQACGLVTIESFVADWSSRDERFSMRFRDPFKSAIGLELASRHYRRIILTLTRADKYLKPSWPTTWQTQEIFHVAGMPTPQHIVAGEDFGGLQRTLAAFCAAYHCDPVDWEINWRTACAPEFRVLPSPKCTAYTDVQLLAVLRALRYNDYFKALSFCDVDLSSLLDKYDSTQGNNVAYMNRNGVCLTTHEASLVQRATLLHQEFHALAFASGTVRQMDFTNCLPARHDNRESVQFLVPILNLLAAGLTRCNRLFLRGCALGDADIDSLAGYIAPNLNSDSNMIVSQEAVALEALDVANCGLSDESMKTLFQALCQSAWTLVSLDVSQNFGRVPATLVQDFMGSVGSLRELNLAGSMAGTYDGEFLPFEVLDRLEHLEALDISSFKLNSSSVDALERYLSKLASRQAAMQGEGYAYALRRLVLTNCGLTGRDAGRMLAAMNGLYDVHVHLSSNPLETGISGLVHAIEQGWSGRIGLHVNMVEFQEEASYVQLVRALAANRCIDYLSLVGTAPVPTNDDTCGSKTVAALTHFFAENQSVRYLDLSGVSSKLDDGQLGKGFGQALAGLAQNKVLTHLRVRNQNLHDSVDALGVAVQENTRLLYVDCGDNGFSATSFHYLAQRLQANATLLMCPIAAEDVEQALARPLKSAPAAVPVAAIGGKQRRKSSAGLTTDLGQPLALLRADVERSVAEIASYMGRNVDLVQQETGCLVDMGEALDTCGERGWPSLQLQMPTRQASSASGMGGMFTTTPLEEEEEAAEAAEAAMVHLGQARASAAAAVAAMPAMPYRVSQDDDALNSPIEGLTPSWGLSSTPSISSEESRLRSVVGVTGVADGGLLFGGRKGLDEAELQGMVQQLTMEDGAELFLCTEPGPVATGPVATVQV